MFTGLIEEVGKISGISPLGQSTRIDLHAPLIAKDLVIGDSVAVEGCCLTAETVNSNGFSAYASPETLKKTSLGDRSVGDSVNLERALTLSTRLGGHMVSGHVDGTGSFLSARKVDDSWEVRIRAPHDITSRSIAKGSIAIDGISLTIVDLTDDELSCWIIPETWERTTLSRRKPGDRINLESDMIGKYVYKFMETALGDKGSKDQRLMDLLSQGGWGSR